MKTEFTAWAINTNYTDIDGKKYPGFIGRYWWKPVPKHLEGCRFALFKTRKEVGIALVNVKQSFPRATVKKVHVTIEETK